MSSWLHRLRGPSEGSTEQRSDMPPPKRRGSANAPPKDPNVPRKRLQIYQKCLYERTLPGNAYISAHVNRLQHGFYQSDALHEPRIENIYFVSVHFVFHPHNPQSHRFKGAEIKVCVHGDDGPLASGKDPYRPTSSHPRILKHAPELMFGAVSPESLQWNFSLSSSLGISQAPVSATLNPNGGLKGSYKVFHMMSIQGSIRSKQSPLGPEHHAEDAMAMWTLEENMRQKSGLPREFDFVLLVQKPDDVENIYLTVDVDADIATWYGSYPQWYIDLPKHMPTQDHTLDFNTDIGQRFLPSHPGRGFNFASLLHSLDEYVTMPGTVYPTNDTKQEDAKSNPNRLDYDTVAQVKAIKAAAESTQAEQSATPDDQTDKTTKQTSKQQNRHSRAPENVNVRVVLEHQYPQSSDSRRFSYSPMSHHEPTRHPSIRRRKSRSGLKEHVAKQALQEAAQNELHDKRASGGDRFNENS